MKNQMPEIKRLLNRRYLGKSKVKYHLMKTLVRLKLKDKVMIYAKKVKRPGPTK